MKIDRHEWNGRGTEAFRRVNFCLDKLERGSFISGISFGTEIVNGLTIEEIIGALVSAEQHLLEKKEAHK